MCFVLLKIKNGKKKYIPINLRYRSENFPRKEEKDNLATQKLYDYHKQKKLKNGKARRGEVNKIIQVKTVLQ